VENEIRIEKSKWSPAADDPVLGKQLAYTVLVVNGQRVVVSWEPGEDGPVAVLRFPS